jgi:DNA primase small subunit
MRQAKPEEIKRFYREEWNKRDLPDFITHTLSLREFGFDLDGSGPNHRYHQFLTVEQLEEFLRYRAPYSAYASVALYENPRKREGWLKADLVFDIDAKDLPLKSCGCPQGQVCYQCIEDAKRVAVEFSDVIRRDLGFRRIVFVYSGRGFHLRVLDESAMRLEHNERQQLVAYVTGAVVPTDLALSLGYSKVFRERAAKTLSALDDQRLRKILRGKRAFQSLLRFKDKVVEGLKMGDMDSVLSLEGIGVGTLEALLTGLAKINSELTDGKVTVDTKRILRLPSSLHSGVSRKCVVVRRLDSFSPDDAVPRFLMEAEAGDPHN